ncbi:MAG: 50S ribosomal protein L13 [Candidatus Pacebacteria bacterium]|nr:50S ribosomal protein L13 [Candidatus Paceibacterota bacterium]
MSEIKNKKPKIVEIDAENKSFGRVASLVASTLRGKTSASFEPNRVPDTKVKILNLAKINFTGKKFQDITYQRYSGYPGNLKILRLKDLFAKNPENVFRKTVERMLPKNRLRKVALKNLIFK